MNNAEPDSGEGSIGEFLAREFEPMEPVFGHPKGPLVAKLEAQVKVTDVDSVRLRRAARCGRAGDGADAANWRDRDEYSGGMAGLRGWPRQHEGRTHRRA